MDIGERPRVAEHEIEWDDEKVSRLWNYYARSPRISDIYFSKLYGGHILKRSRLDLGESLDVLDFGCGPGYIWDHLKRAGSRWRYTGIDFSRSSADETEKRASGDANFKGAHHISQLPTPLPGASFDVILLLEVVEHLNDKHLAATLQEAARLLKKGGVLVVTTPNDEDLDKSMKFCPECGAIFHEWQHVRSWSAGELVSCLSDCGFSPRFTEAVDFSIMGSGVVNLFRSLKSTVKKSFSGYRSPHMIAVFQKPVQ
jgi:SAM-dependent methyltransferase